VSDDELQALERAVAAGGGPEARLRYARALERVGRRDEALDALLPGRESADVRREIARSKAARTDLTEAASSVSVADLAPIERAPRVAWKRRFEEDVDGSLYDEEHDSLRTFATHPLVAAFHGHGAPFRVIDAVTGADRWQHVPEEPDAGELVIRLTPTDALIWDGTELRVRELWTGEERCRFEPEVRLNGFAGEGDRLATWSGGELTLGRLAASGPEPLWTSTIRGGSVASVLFQERQLLVETGDRLLALDLEEGRTRWTLPGKVFLADERGILRRGKPRDLTYHDLEGEKLWSYRRPAWVTTLLPGAVLAGTDAGSIAIDRETGEAGEPWHAPGPVLACARAAIYYKASPGLVARALDGRERWETPLELAPEEWLQRASPGHRSLTLLTDQGTILRLE
jgi:hypothetical protein